jgi:hypothetical protein
MAFVFLINVVVYTKNSVAKIRHNQENTLNLPSIYTATRIQVKGLFEKFHGKLKKKIISLDIFEVLTEKELVLRFRVRLKS